jgi:predicted nucleic acid-binding Zn ribbon protein
MEPASSLLSRVLPSLMARAPLTPDKVEFAWRTVVGPAIARATRVQLVESGTLVVRAENVHWGREVEKAFPVILPRVRALLGDEAVRRLTVIEG